MDVKTLIPLLLQVSIMLIVFSYGLQSTLKDALYLFHRPGLLLRSVTAMYIIMPIIAVALVRAIDLPPAVKIAIVTLSVSPIPPLLGSKSLKAGGQGSYVIGMLVAPAILAIAFIPLALALFERIFQIPLATKGVGVMKIVATSLLAPLAVGMLVRKLLGARALRLAKPLSLVATIILLAGVVPVLFVMWPALRALTGNGTLAVMALFAAIGVIVGHVLGSEEQGHRQVLALSTATRHPGIAMAIASANFPDLRETAPAVLLYVLVSAIVTAPYFIWRKKSHAAATTPVTT